ncbi:hypothetical protein MHM98_05185 [Psychrobium sp. MM17-31]|uniref:hypothetical protein n=1 Tax=Psychrobium sp. MM17-31 TaxID=2917758 RepID=UPI001EF60C5B|nr:hypothetical protein [Psychrobium sp. MM17-31]MCG7530749.1 hypothetical protein [Psychrobium sp. MM17-31]
MPNKRGFVEEYQPKLLDSLGIASDDWIEIINHFRRQYGKFVGSLERLRQCANEHYRCRYKDIG